MRLVRVVVAVSELALVACLVGGGTLQAQPGPLRSQNSIAQGVEYIHERHTNVPWSIHIVQLDRRQTDLTFVPTLARGKTLGLATVSEQVNTLGPGRGIPLVAINGDFFVILNSSLYRGDPRGLQVINGELISTPTNNACFWLDAHGQPHASVVSSRLSVAWPDRASTPIGLNEECETNHAVLYTLALGESTRTTNTLELALEKGRGRWLPLRLGRTYNARVREVRTSGNTLLAPNRAVLALSTSLAQRATSIRKGDRLKISTRTEPDISEAQFALGGGPLLVVQGKAQSWPPPLPRHPRSAIGWNARHFFFVAVDGRQTNLSVGMNFTELAGLMAHLGCTEAMNLDGGGSTTLWIDGRVVNSPSDGHERPVANALVLVRKKPGAISSGPKARQH